MRNNIVHIGAHELRYEIREIVTVGNRLHDMGLVVCWENIGDPIHKGEKIPSWIKEVIKEGSCFLPAFIMFSLKRIVNVCIRHLHL